jgi:alcohol dehydrogenase class IV
MWAIKKIGIRIFQFVFFKGAYLLPWKKPELIEGDGSFARLPEFVKSKGFDNVIIITDKGLLKTGLLKPLFKGLDSVGVKYTLCDNVEPNPKIDDIEEAVAMYKNNGCRAIIAVGGGSPMDTAKAVGARIARPGKTIEKLGGTLKVRWKIPTLFAVPTTAGTGSETTVAAVVTDRETHHKYSINDLFLIPPYAVMDPLLHVGLPPFITATTGMDALTHAVEAYLTVDRPKYCREACEEAVIAIFKYIEKAYKKGSDIDARRELLYASYKAGLAFTRCGVTYVHPIAHTLGGLYNIPHGLANAVILPYCLEYYGPKIYPRLARLADLTVLPNRGQTEEEKARAFIAEIRRMNKAMKLQDKFDCIRDEDIDQIVEWALDEAHPMYQVPVLLNGDHLREIISRIRA